MAGSRCQKWRDGRVLKSGQIGTFLLMDMAGDAVSSASKRTENHNPFVQRGDETRGCRWVAATELFWVGSPGLATCDVSKLRRWGIYPRE